LQSTGRNVTKSSTIWGGLDAGGTAFKCAIADVDGRLIQAQRFSTGADPHVTLSRCAEYFRAAEGRTGARLAALGVACFGPLDIDPDSPRHGFILATPKPGWSGADVRGGLARRLDAPVAIDTDVNAALAAEMRWGAARGAASAAYVTVGTGIGAGIHANGGFLGRPAHPEFGHIAVRRHPADADFPGICPFHGACLEGMASASALAARFGDTAAMPADHPGWRIAAHYLAQAALALVLTLRPEKIVLGGGLMLAPGLIEAVRLELFKQLTGYLALSMADIDALLIAPGLGDDAGVCGGVLLALDATSAEKPCARS
jgi:fructokinase